MPAPIGKATPNKLDAAATPAVAPIAVTGALKDSIDLYSTKLNNDQLQQKDITTQYQQVSGSIKADYENNMKLYTEAIDKARKDLKVPADFKLDMKDFTFKSPSDPALKSK